MNKRIGSLLLLMPAMAIASPPMVRLSLSAVEEQTLRASPRWTAAVAESASAESQAKSEFATLWPRITFDANYRYVSEVPHLRPLPIVAPIPFGDNNNYSYGPAVSWTLFDAGVLRGQWKSAQARWRERKDEEDALRRQLLLEARTAYFQTQLALEQVWLLSDSLKLAQAQHTDIRNKERAGTVSRIDTLSFHQDVLGRRRLLREAQADLAGALRGLYAVMGSTAPPFLSVPTDARALVAPPKEIDAPTVLIVADPIAASRARFEAALLGQFDGAHPQLQALSDQADAAQRAAAGIAGGVWPQIQVAAKTSRDYPNGPILESIHQNTVGLTASVPLFEKGRTRSRAKAQRDLADASLARREQSAINLERDWYRAHDQLAALETERAINRQAVAEANQLAKLTYQSYTAGSSTYLEVQNANLRVLQADVTSAQADVQALLQLAILDSLSSQPLTEGE